MRRAASPSTTLIGITGLLLLLAPVESTTGVRAAAANGASSTTRLNYTAVSWAQGVVIPERAALQGGGRLGWEGVANVTALLTLPNITLPDRIVYVALSVMTSDGTVLQVAAGVYPNSSEWLTYAWSISNVESVPITYRWVLNGSGPQIPPGAAVSMSIFRQGGTWNFGVTDLRTGSSVRHPFPAGEALSLKVGDQEVFAFESYSWSGATFRGMGNLTLDRLMTDGQRVTGGFYLYSAWDPSRNPLFVVGSSGTSPPDFISSHSNGDGSFAWSYATSWRGYVEGFPSGVGVALAILLLVVLGITLVLTLSLTRKRNVKPKIP